MKAPVFNGVFDIILKTFKDPVKGVFYPGDGGASAEVDFLFLDNHRDVDDRGVPYGSPKPTAWIKQGCVDAKYGDYIIIEGTEYTIREVEPASDQYTKLILQDDRRP